MRCNCTELDNRLSQTALLNQGRQKPWAYEVCRNVNIQTMQLRPAREPTSFSLIHLSRIPDNRRRIMPESTWMQHILFDAPDESTRLSMSMVSEVPTGWKPLWQLPPRSRFPNVRWASGPLFVTIIWLRTVTGFGLDDYHLQSAEQDVWVRVCLTTDWRQSKARVNWSMIWISRCGFEWTFFSVLFCFLYLLLLLVMESYCTWHSGWGSLPALVH